MATKTSKRAGETSTTVSVGIRIDPKIKFALDLMGRLQKRSLTAVIEWAIANAIAQQRVDTSMSGESLDHLLDEIWSTDESMRLIMLAIHLPAALTYDELRIWETIKASAPFWRSYPDGSFEVNPERIELDRIRACWSEILAHVERTKLASTITPITLEDLLSDDVPF